MQALIATLLVFGVGSEAPNRYSPIMASVNSSFLRRSGVRNADANAVSTHPPARVKSRFPLCEVRRATDRDRISRWAYTAVLPASLTASFGWRRAAIDR